jgi:type I restriction enzyme S subunit
MGQKTILSRTIGASQSAITIENLKKSVLAIPKISEQIQIAEMLSSLDDKIELNRKMNETLEKIGQTLFKH